jgi:hypothetical protein
MFPPAPIGFLRTIQEGGDVIDGERLPGGVSSSLCNSRYILYILLHAFLSRESKWPVMMGSWWH